ncbi:hypothetical protein [Cupriavidus necator]
MTHVKTIRAVLASKRFIAIDLHLHENAPVEVLMCLRPVEPGIDVTLEPLQTPGAMTADQAFAFAWAKAQGVAQHHGDQIVGVQMTVNKLSDSAIKAVTGELPLTLI